MWKKALKFIAFLLIGYLFIVGLITLMQNQLIFQPSSELWDTPDRLNLEWSEHRVETSDGVMLHGWMIGDPSENPIVVYSHGNAGNISGRIDIAGDIAGKAQPYFCMITADMAKVRVHPPKREFTSTDRRLFVTSGKSTLFLSRA